MRIQLLPSRKSEKGYGLLLTLGFAALAMILLASVFKLASSEASLTARNVGYNNAVIAAESATETVISQMDYDFNRQALNSDVTKYTGVLPGAFVKNSWPSDYKFSGAKGAANESAIVCVGWQAWTNLNSEFKGLYGMVNSYQITSTAQKKSGLYPVKAAVRQEIQLTAVPVFQFAIFYSMDLEINPGADMVVSGKTHGNANFYSSPGTSLIFEDSVTAASHIYHHRHPDDPNTDSGIAPTYHSSHVEGVSTLNVPVGTDNNPSNVVQILDPPPSGETNTTQMAKQRYYNKSNLIITTTSTGVKVEYNQNNEGSSFTSVTTNITSGSGFSFINTNVTFYDYREKKPVLATEVDVQALINWMKGSGSKVDQLAQTQNGKSINSIYVYDKRDVSGKLTAVRIVNGQALPTDGLTVATPSPLYVKGNFNAPDLKPGSTNTSNTKPASLICDAITILSTNWSDSSSSSTKLDKRPSVNTTVNCAILSGIVPTQKDGNGDKHYSGGVENFPRLLENWSGTTLTYNGSMVVMFASRRSTNFWVNTGTYYNAPTRKWAFDKNFLDMTKLPPGTPQVRKLQRGLWSVVSAN